MCASHADRRGNCPTHPTPRCHAGEVSDSVADKLVSLCAALDAGDLVSAPHVQVSLTTNDWDECASWLTALKRLIKARQMLG